MNADLKKPSVRLRTLGNALNLPSPPLGGEGQGEGDNYSFWSLVAGYWKEATSKKSCLPRMDADFSQKVKEKKR
jgi:uncharacterized protein (DUF2237 family)